MNEDLFEIICRDNQISTKYFWEIVHISLIFHIVHTLCTQLDNNTVYQNLLNSCKSRGWRNGIRSFLENNLKIKLPKADLIFISNILFLRLSKNARTHLPPNTTCCFSDKIIRCECCGKELSKEQCCIDHIIPYSWVGDELLNNYQILCESCNRMKSNDPWFILKYLAMHGTIVNYFPKLQQIYLELTKSCKF